MQHRKTEGYFASPLALAPKAVRDNSMKLNKKQKA